MHVKSPIADMDIDIKTVSIQGTYIVVKSDPKTSIETTVYISPLDFWVFIRALFTSALLFYIVTYPIRYIAHKMELGKQQSPTLGSTVHEKHPTSHPW